MKIGVLTSSRADYGIYLPFLEKVKSDSYFKLEIIAFGTHLSKSHGYTVDEIKKGGYKTIHQISSLISNDDPQSIATSYGLTALKFADFWEYNSYDLVFCLGDRFEMSAAVQAGIPIGIKFAHIHGGETTLGAIDNIYRHQITLASTYHFTAADVFSKKIEVLLESTKNIYTVGSLSLDNIHSFQPINKKEFHTAFSIPKTDFALVTFHPETVSFEDNYEYAIQMKEALSEISKRLYVIITMPNADTMGSIYRTQIEQLKNEHPNRILLIENFGKTNYFTAMYYSKLLIGNTSSGILEAASFHKYVVNVGHRQQGRLQSSNVVNCEFKKEDILNATENLISKGEFHGENVYFKEGAANAIISIIKNRA
jgi:GDP/UDP-N,N'-diacetylbacillosamine 2-epimerase (hydrolysing)